MPRNASGLYSLPAAYNPVATDELITAAWANTTLSDLGQAISDSLDRYGRGGMLAPFKNNEGTVGLPGITFGLETTTGISRPNSGQMSFSIQGAEVFRLDGLLANFYVPPRCTVAPGDDNALANKLYVDTQIATRVPLDNPVFNPLQQITWAGTPTGPNSLVNKNYVDQLAFNSALPGVAAQDVGAQIYVDPAGVAQWSQEPAEHDALGILNFIGA